MSVLTALITVSIIFDVGLLFSLTTPRDVDASPGFLTILLR